MIINAAGKVVAHDLDPRRCQNFDYNLIKLYLLVKAPSMKIFLFPV